MVAAQSKSTNNEELLQMAIRAAKNGQKDGARVMLRQVWDRDKRNEMALLWLAKLSRTAKERKEWLNRLLKVNPNNETAKSALAKLQHQHAARENHTLLLFGAVAVVMIALALAILVVALA